MTTPGRPVSASSQEGGAPGGTGTHGAPANDAVPADNAVPTTNAVPSDNAMSEGAGKTAANRPRVTLRPMRPSDLRRVANLEVELFGMGAWTYGMLESELMGPGQYVVAVVPGTIPGADRVVGYAGLQFDGDNTDIATIGVASEAQRWGIGSQLMDFVIARSGELGAQGVFLEVAVNNEPAQAMYRKYGFEQIGLRKRYYQPENLDAYTMRLELENEVVSDPRASVFITAHELGDLVADRLVKILDVRWQLGRNDGKEQHAQAHIPGALYVDLDTELAVHASPEQGRHPLPTRADFQKSVQSWGVHADSTVIVYDATGGTSAARAWWMLKNAGLSDVRILDGGINAWTAAGLATEAGAVSATPSAIELTDGAMPTITIDEAAVWAEEGILIDARASERFRGEVEPVDPRAGHIPGALNVPTFGFLAADQTIKPREELIATLIEAGVIDPQVQSELDSSIAIDQPIAAYCGSGVTASHEIAVLTSLGLEVALFPGSWSQWSNDPQRPAVTGE